MKYDAEIYTKALIALAELRKTVTESEAAAIDFVAEAIVEKGDRDYGDDAWISVEAEPPKNEQVVLACVNRKHYSDPQKFHRFVVKAFYTDGKHNSEESDYTWCDCEIETLEYDEEADAYKIPEGWWERVDYGETFSAIDDAVTHWMPLPQTPKG